MRPLLAEELLGVWERGMGQSPARRALSLLAIACRELSIDALAKLSIGKRDALLLTLRRWTFGPDLVCLTHCKSCGEQLDLNISAAELSVAASDDESQELSLSRDGYDLRFRVPNSRDLDLVTSCRDIAAGRQLLLQRCLYSITEHGEKRALDQLPDELIVAVVERMEEHDPQANVELLLSCPVCKHEWTGLFDIESFFWKEIGAWASRTLNEIHALASVYGWSETDLLNMSPWRRQAYLNLINQ
jgi:T4 bacteriophage base plate protein